MAGRPLRNPHLLILMTIETTEGRLDPCAVMREATQAINEMRETERALRARIRTLENIAATAKDYLKAGHYEIARKTLEGVV